MKISLITPANKRSRAGNRTTAVRWAGILRALGHRVRIAVTYGGEPCEAMIALHAWRSAQSIRDYRAKYPAGKLIVALTGTDIYRFIHSDRAVTLGSLALADRLVGLHDLVGDAIPKRFRRKLSIIHQSAPPPRRAAPVKGAFEVLVIGHLRAEKDPLRAALAARLLPADSRVRIVQLGRAFDADWETKARAEMAANPRYRWRGEVPGWAVRRMLARAPAMVLSSVMEGGANVVSEAVMAGCVVIASRIPGSVGLLGRNYPGYYPVGDEAKLARLLARAEREPRFAATLRRHGRARAHLFTAAREKKSWRALLASLKP
jgi:putative glycosyltransferase (TIGR04348 family)